MTTTHTHSHSSTSTCLRRWPTVLAVAAVGAVVALDEGGDGPVGGLTAVLPVLPAMYTVMLAVGRRRWTWPLLLLSMAGVTALQTADVIDLQTTLIVAGTAGLGAALIRGRSAREVALQGAGLVLFGGAALVAAHTAPDVALWAVAAGWLGHGVWDLWHLRRDAVVSRSFAEWCGVVDVLVATVLATASLSA